MKFTLKPGCLTFSDLKILMDESVKLALDDAAWNQIHQAAQLIQDIILQETPVYGVNTGFGALAKHRIPVNDLEKLQTRLVLSHAAGTGAPFVDNVIRLILLLKINSLSRGFSGVRPLIIEALIALFNAHIYPCIPEKGSVGASGDLAPLAHLSAMLLGFGEARYHGQIINAQEALAIAGLKPLTLAPKEGLALLNGTQVSTALAILALMEAENLLSTALMTGALSTDAACGSDKPFDARIQVVRGHSGQIKIAAILRDLLKGSEIRASHQNCDKVQDPYSLRCQPQVMGACLTQLAFNSTILMTEANAVSDNPLIFPDDHVILSGGNFHAEPVAIAADTIAICLTEIASLSERRIALLIDQNMSGLPAFLVREPGINSGFMIPQVTAAALVSENKSLAHPASVDSIPTSANQEDHVSMATYAARRLLTIAENTATVISIELLAACQGIDLLHPLHTSSLLQSVYAKVRQYVPFYESDRFMAPDIDSVKALVQAGEFSRLTSFHLFE